MIKLYYIFFMLLFSIFLFEGCRIGKPNKKKFHTSKKVICTNCSNKKQKEGFHLGWLKAAKDEGSRKYEKGYQEGLRKGKEIGYQDKLLNLYLDYHGQYQNPDGSMKANVPVDEKHIKYLADLIQLMNRKLLKLDTSLNGAYNRGFIAGKIAGETTAFLDLYKVFFDLFYKINLAKGQYLDLNNAISNNPSSVYISYDSIVNELNAAYLRKISGKSRIIDSELEIHKIADNIFDSLVSRQIAKVIPQINGTSQDLELSIFSKSVRTIHERVIDFVVIKLHLSAAEESHIRTEYNRIHEGLAKKYFQSYVKRLQQTGIPYQESFYDFRYYHSVHLFVDVINEGLCSLMDVLLTYAKANPQYAAQSGFEVMGYMCDMLQNEVMLQLDDNLRKYAMMKDYNAIQPRIRESLISTIGSNNMIAETRYHRKTVEDDVIVEDNAEFKHKEHIKMEIETIFNIGFPYEKAEDISVEVNHLQQKFVVTINNSPRLIGIIYQSYKIISIDHTMEYIQEKNVYKPGNLLDCEPIKEKDIEKTEHTHNYQADFQRIFDANKPNAEEIMETQKDIKNELINLLMPLISKILEPCHVLVNSRYSTFIKFGHDERCVIKSKYE
jgi:hypothetical protein